MGKELDIPEPEPDVRRDQWGRYLVVPPDGGKPKGYSRATTVAKALDDTSNLMNWGKRMVALGLVARPDILAMVAATDKDDRKALDSHCERAAEAGGATARRDLGTAIHKLVERKIADPSWEVPELYARDVDAIVSAIDAAGYDIVTEYSEIVVVLDRHEIAGTADLILRRRSDGALVVADIKTGASVKYGALAWAIQLSVYATADAIYRQGGLKDGSEDRREPMPENVDKDMALILHCEPGSGSCDVHQLDIARGAKALDVAMSVRNWRKEKGLLTPHEPAEAPDPADGGEARVAPTQGAEPSSATPDDDLHAARIDWVMRRIETIREAGHTQTLGRSWPKDGPAKPGDVRKGSAFWTPADMETVVRLVDECEARWEMPFGETDPAVLEDIDAERAEAAAKEAEMRAAIDARPEPLRPSPDDGEPVSDEKVAELRARIKGLPKTLSEHVIGWSRQAINAKVPWNMGSTPTTRRAAIAELALDLVDAVDPDADDPDELVRAALRQVVHGLADVHSVGAVLGSLDALQVPAVRNVLNHFRVVIDDNGTPQFTAAA